MKQGHYKLTFGTAGYVATLLILFAVLGMPRIIGDHDSVCFANGISESAAIESEVPVPLLEKGYPVKWWFVFKFNAATFPECGENAQRDCIFGGNVNQGYGKKYSQRFVYASSENPSLQKGVGCLGDTLEDPVGATFDQVYNNSYYYVIWNDQFYDDPPIADSACKKSKTNKHGNCFAPWGHSKGMLVWNKEGEGLVMQVSTPSWPASGSKSSPRKKDGNTLGCVMDNNVEVSQHFFALKLNKDDLKLVLDALQITSVVTDPTNSQIVQNGGPSDVQMLVGQLGKKSSVTFKKHYTLSTGVEMIAKPSRLHVPPWQLVSAELKGLPLRAATWWTKPKIDTTTEDTTITCWSGDLGKPGSVEIATSGQWDGKTFSLIGVPQPSGNHAKIGVSTDSSRPYSIIGDLNQQGVLSGAKCGSSQNGRGGMFYIINDKAFFESLSSLIKGKTASMSEQ